MTTYPHTIEDALDRFSLIQGQGDGETSACVMTAISWVAGEAWSDAPSCAHPILTRMAIIANDHGDTSAAQRAEILRAGAEGLIDTWWIPGEVIAAAQIRPPVVDGESPPAETPVERVIRVLGAVAWWKADKQRANLGYANLRYANLRYADLRYADLRYADLRSADLRYANLRSADLRYADLGYADLGYANLRSADLGYANLGYANLGYANLRYANLRYANLGSAYGNKYTVLPKGWHIDESTGLVVADVEVEA